MGCCDNKTNCLLMIVNGLTVLVGILITVCGVLAILNQPELEKYSGGYNIEMICYGILITGVIILVVGAIGWYAGFTSNIRVCKVYCILIIIIVILQAVFAALEYLKKEDVMEEVGGYLNTTFSSNGTEYSKMNNATQQIVNLVQEKLECCGFNNATDWVGGPPASCCATASNTTSNSTEPVKCTVETAYKTGCNVAAQKLAGSAVMFSFYILLVGFGIEFLCIFAALWVVREANRYTKLSRA